jgi:inner membrane protein
LLGEGVIEHKRAVASTWLRPSPASLGLVALGLLAADWGSRLAGNSVVPGGPLDEAAHLLTTLLVLWALDPRVGERFMVPALVASVAIDIDHVPGEFGVNWLTAGTPRPYTHSLVTVAVVVAAALLWRRIRTPMLGAAFGLALHLWRDMSETGNGVALLWPFSYRSVRLSHAGYLAVMALVAAAAAYRVRAARR